MKTISANVMLRALSVLTVLLSLSGTALSSGDVRFQPVQEDGKVIVSLEDVQARKVSLSIENKSEDVVYFSTKVSGNEDFKKVFDFTNLADGTYYLIARYDNNTLKKEFTIQNSKIVSESKTIDFACQPVFRSTNEGLIVLFQCPTNEDVEVSFKSDYSTFFRHNAENSKIATVFNTQKLPVGNYEVVLTAGQYEFNYDLEVK